MNIMKTLLNIVAILASFGALASPSDPVIEQYWLDNDIQSRFANTRVYNPSSSNQVTFNVGDLSEGGHAFHYRMATQAGNKVMWGRPVTKYFYIPTAKDKSNSVPTAYRLLLNGNMIEMGVVPDASSFTLTPAFPENVVLSYVNSRDFKYLLGEKKISMTAYGRISYAVQLMSDQKEWGAPLYKEIINQQVTTKLDFDSIKVPEKYTFDKVDNNGFKAYRFRNLYRNADDINVDNLYIQASQDCRVSLYYVNKNYESNLCHIGSYELKKDEPQQVTAYYDYDVFAVFYDTPTDKKNTADKIDIEIMLEDHKVPKPIVNLSSDTWEVTMTCPDPRATIWYTTDGSDPSESESHQAYSAPLLLNKFTRIRAYAVMEDKYGYEASDKVVHDFGSSHLVIPTPELKFAGGLENNEFVFDNRVEGVTTYYTFGNNDLDDEGLRTKFDGKPFAIEDGQYIKAYAEKKDENGKNIVSPSQPMGRYVYLNDFVTPKPDKKYNVNHETKWEYDDEGNRKPYSRQELMSFSVPGGTTYYYRILKDGKHTFDPTEQIDKTQWTEYKKDEYNDGLIWLGGANSGNQTVQVFAESEGKARSSVEDIYTDWVQASEPTFVYDNYNFKLYSDVPNAVIRYYYYYNSNEVKEFTQEDAAQGIKVSDDDYMIFAYVESEGYSKSNEASIHIGSFRLSSPSIEYEEDGLLHIRHDDKDPNLQMQIEIKSQTPGRTATYKASNHYTYDALPNDTVRAYVKKTGWNNSSVSEKTPLYRPSINVSDYYVYIDWGYSGDIYYTLDGTLPTKESNHYDGGFYVDKACTVRAVAYYYYDGYIPSEAEPMRVLDQAEKPVAKFNYSVQNTEEGPVEVKKIYLECPTPNAKIYYAIGRSLTDTSRTLYNPSWDEEGNPDVDWAGLDVSAARYLYAYAEADDYRRSEEIYVEMSDGYLSTPDFTVKDYGVVEIWSNEPTATIVTSFDPWQEPTVVKDSESNKISFSVLPGTTVRAHTEKNGCFPSNDIEILPTEKPVIYVDGNRVSFSYYWRDELHYTLDGSTPTRESALYDGDSFEAPVCTVNAIAFREDGIPSVADPVKVLAQVETPSVVYAFDRATDKRHVKLRCATPDAKIYYSLDRGLSDTSRKLYDAAADTLDVTDKSYIYLYAEKDGFRRSEEYYQYINDAYLYTPSIQVDGLSVVISSDDPAVTIVPVFYKGTAANAYVPEDLAYVHEGDVNKITATVDFNTTVKAHTERAGYYASSDNEANPLEKPTVIVNDYNVYIDYPYWGEVFYTTDGSVPSQLSIPYVGSFDSQACTIRAAAFADGYIPSLSESAKVMDPAAMPEIDIDNGFAKLNSATPGAVIWYSLDQGIGAGTRKLYDPAELPDGIDISNVNTIYSYAEADGYRQSETLNFYKGEFTLEAPSLEYANGYVTAEHDDDEVVIRFADGDGNALQAEADNARKVKAEYNKTVVAYAYRKGWVNSRSVQVKHVDAPTITANLFDISIKGKSGQTLRYTTDGSQPTTSSQEYTAPFHVTSSCTVRAAAFVDDQIPSEATAVSVNYRKSNAPAVASYDGRYLTLSAENGSTIKYLIGSTGSVENTGVVANGKIDVEGLKTVRAMAQRSDADDSEVFSFTPEYYANESDVYTSKAGVLKNAFEWCSDLSDFSSLAVHGVMLGSAEEDNGDYEFLRSLPNLRHLDLSKVTDENVPAGALASKQLVSVTLPETLKSTGEFVFGEDNSTLCAVELPASGFAPVHLLDGVKNPNLLLYAKSTNYVSDLIAATDGVVKNVVVLGSVNNRAEGVTLTHADPFYASREFNAQKINFTREFTKQTQIGGFGSGWETMVVPFDVQTIACGTKTLKPFGDAVTDRGECPFWLFEAGENDWIPSGSIMANTPYLLAMPNNPLYAEEFVVNGNVTFSANNVTVAVTPDEEDMTFAFGTGKYIAGNYSLIDKDDSMLAINDEVFNYRNTDFQPGGLFVAGMKDVVPFECYVLSQSVSAMPVFDQSSIDEIMDEYGTHVWGENYCIFIRSAISMKVRIYDSVGQLIRSVDVKAGETVQVNDITPGIYFVGSNKILVKG